VRKFFGPNIPIKAIIMKIASPQSGTTKQGWIVSLAFWFCLFLAAAMYAVVVLAPKWNALLILNSEHRNTQIQLVSLEQDVKRLGKVVSALENDTELTAELARVDFGAVRPGDEQLAVDEDLKMNIQSLQRLTPPHMTQQAAASDLVRLFSQHRRVRHLTLAAAGLLSLFAFCFLIEPRPSGSTPPDDSPSLCKRLINRYRKK
jgi:cell division protein FtsB